MAIHNAKLMSIGKKRFFFFNKPSNTKQFSEKKKFGLLNEGKCQINIDYKNPSIKDMMYKYNICSLCK
jgi:hypothetical protein